MKSPVTCRWRGWSHGFNAHVRGPGGRDRE